MLRGKTHDGAANMSGEFKDCQAIVAKQQPLALYVHCGAHCVNLVSQAVSERTQEVRDELQVVNELGVLFSQSMPVRNAFSKIIAESDVGRRAYMQIRPLCPTRWLVRVKAVTSLLSQYESVLACLEEMSTARSSVSIRAAGLFGHLRKSSTVIALLMSIAVFTPLEILNRAFQFSSQSVAGMLEAVGSVLGELQALRTDQDFDCLLEKVAQMQKDCDLDALEVPRQRRPPARFTGPAACTVAMTVSDYYKPKYFELLDNAISELRERFTNSAGLRQYSIIEQTLLSGRSTNEAQTVLALYPELDVDDLAAELRMFHRGRTLRTLAETVTVLKSMCPEVRAEFRQVCTLVRLLLVCPASSAQAERSFSALRRIKTWLRTTMTQTRLNAIAVCHINRNMTDRVNVTELMTEFVSRSDIRKTIFGRFLKE